MLKAKTCALLAILFLSTVFVQTAWTIAGKAKVYIICLNGVQGWFVDDPSRVKDGALDACMIKGEHVECNSPLAHPENGDNPPYYDVEPKVVTSWSEYVNIILSYSEVIVVNTHGEYLPVPNSYSETQWVDKIADAMLNRRVTWVHVGAYPFYRVWKQNGAHFEWGDYGFKNLTEHIGKPNVNCWPPTDENSSATLSIQYSQSLGLTWGFSPEMGNAVPITGFHAANLGRPLKEDDFRENLILPLFEYIYDGKIYWTGGVFAFAKPSDRTTGNHGCGAFVHIGARYLRDINGDLWDGYHDFGRGFIGTAAALWVETNGFNPTIGVESIWAPQFQCYQESSIIMHPSIARLWQDGTYCYVTLSFAFHAILKTSEDDDGYTFYMPGFPNIAFLVSPSQDWIDQGTRVKAELGDDAISKQGRNQGFDFSGLYSTGSRGAGLMAESLIFLFSLVPHPIIQGICATLGGVMLMAEWLEIENFYAVDGVYDYSDSVLFQYEPVINYEVKGDGYRHEELSSIIAVNIRIPQNVPRNGWNILSIYYATGVETQNGYGPSTEGVLSIAVWFPGGGQRDACIEGDAPNNFGNARQVSFPSSNNYGYLDGLPDEVDWYKFQVNSGTQVQISMTPPPYVNFDLELYSPADSTNPKARSTKTSGTEGIVYTIDITGQWRIRIYKVTGSGVYSFSLNYYSSGCPFVYAWNGEEYVLDNNLLPKSEEVSGTDVEDYYRLEKTLLPICQKSLFSLYSLRLGEFENEHSYIDKAELLAVDHDSQTEVAVDSNGRILTYKNAYQPVSCFDNNGNDALGLIRAIDDQNYLGQAGDYLLLDFGNLSVQNGAKLVMRADEEIIKWSIHVQILNATQDWETVAVVIPRVYWATEIVDLLNYLPDVNGELKIRLYFTASHKLDFIGLDTTTQDALEIHEAILMLAIHSTDGLVTWKLRNSDNIYIELVPGQHVTVVFLLPNSQEERRTLILYVEGHYYTISP